MIPPLYIEIAFGDDPLTENDSATWVDVSDYSKGTKDTELWIKRGRQHERGEIEAGRAIVVLNNNTYLFDPKDSTGTYFGQILPMVKIRIWTELTIDAVLTPFYLFTGYVERWDVRYFSTTNLSTATLHCVDAFKYFNLTEIPTPMVQSQEDSGLRIDAILDEIGWASGERVIAVGDVEVPAMTVEKVSALAAIQDIAKAERGLFYMNGRGNAVYEDRSHRNTMLSSGLWTDAPSDIDEYPYSSFITRLDDSDIWNHIVVRRTGGIEQSVEDATSIAAYFRRTLVMDDMLLVSDAAALEAADWTLAQFKDVRERPEVMTIEPATRSDTDDTWAAVIGRDISDVVQIDRRTPDLTDTTGSIVEAGFTASFNAFIEGIEYSIRKRKWKITWQLSPSFTITPGTGTQNTEDDWIEPTFEGTWDNHGDPNDMPAGYRKEGEWVYLRGIVDFDVEDTDIFILPVGYRPRKWVQVFGAADPTGSPPYARIVVTTSGAVRLVEGDPWVSLDQISFRVV